MEENSSIGFWKIAVSVLLAAILIGVIFLIARQGKSVANEKLEGISNAISDYQDETYAMYAGMEVSGAEVRAVIEKACTKGDYVAVHVETKAGSKVDYNYDCDTATMKITQTVGTTKTYSSVEAALTTASDYINPSAVFKGTVSRDKNGVLVLVSFVQK